MNGGDPGEFFGVRAAIEGDSFERIGHARFLFRVKGIAVHQRKPEAVGQDYVVQEGSEFGVTRGSVMFADGLHQGCVGVDFVADQVLEHCEHGEL